jgi:Gpi18-like mannosyltransferase
MIGRQEGKTQSGPKEEGRLQRRRWLPSRDGRARSEWFEGFLYCIKVFLGVRVILAVLGLIAVAVIPHVPPGGTSSPVLGQVPGPVDVPGWPAHEITAGWHNLVTVWERFDALWFLRIAADGYRSHDGSAAFFPLFPMLVRGVSWLIGGHPLAGGLIVSNGAALGATVALYELTRTEISERVARGSVLFLSFFPTSFFLVAPYSESLFLLLAVVALLAARRSRWWLAGVAGALAALTRNLGVLIAVPLAVEALLQARERRPSRLRPEALWGLAPVAGLAVYLWFWRDLSGDWLAPIHQQSGWQRVLVTPWWTLIEATRDAYRFIGIYPGGYHLLDWVIAVPILVAAIVSAVRFRPTYTAYALVMLVPPLLYVFRDRPLMSFPRFALVAFPILWVFSRWTDRGSRRHVALAASAGLMGLLFVLFANWFYVF